MRNTFETLVLGLLFMVGVSNGFSQRTVVRPGVIVAYSSSHLTLEKNGAEPIIVVRFDRATTSSQPEFAIVRTGKTDLSSSVDGKQRRRFEVVPRAECKTSLSDYEQLLYDSAFKPSNRTVIFETPWDRSDRVTIELIALAPNVKRESIPFTTKLSCFDLVSVQPLNKSGLNSEKTSSLKPVLKVRRNPMLNSVYIVFDRFEGPRKKEGVNEESGRVVLRLWNNTKFPIAVNATGDAKTFRTSPITLSDGTNGEALKHNLEVQLCYDPESVNRVTERTFVEEIPLNQSSAPKVVIKQKSPEPTPFGWHRESCIWSPKSHIQPKVYWLRSGDSVLFSVSRKAFIPGTRLFTEFYFEWEVKDGWVIHGEPTHRIFFDSSRVPDFSRTP